MRGIDPRLGERLPLSLFTHVCCNHLNLQTAEIARQNGQNIFGVRTDVREVLSDYQCLPKSITDYITHASNVLTQTGVELKMNLPNIAIPLGPVGDVPSGSFGPINPNTHNVYEAYPCPLVTANRVIGSQQNAANYQPLPDALIPGNLVPNRNLLGFGLIDAQNQGIQQRLQGIVFLNDDSIEGRYKVSHTACSRVYIILSELKDRFKMTELRRLENKEGLNAMEKLIPKIASANLTFVESEGPANPLVLHLYDRNVNVYSNSSQGSATANQANIEAMHRRRIILGAQAAPGPCYCTQAGNGPGGWAITSNDNFNMLGFFAPVIHFDYPAIRQELPP